MNNYDQDTIDVEDHAPEFNNWLNQTEHRVEFQDIFRVMREDGVSPIYLRWAMHYAFKGAMNSSPRTPTESHQSAGNLRGVAAQQEFDSAAVVGSPRPSFPYQSTSLDARLRDIANELSGSDYDTIHDAMREIRHAHMDLQHARRERDEAMRESESRRLRIIDLENELITGEA